MYRRVAGLLAAGLALGCAEGGDASAGLVLVRRQEGSLDLVRVRLADGAERPVTRTPEREETWPYWSEAGGRLLFQARRPGERNDLFLWDPAGEREIPLLETPERDERWPRWSPDGRRVVYAFQGGEPAVGLGSVRIADRALELLAGGGEGELFLRPHFAPDGRSLVFQRRRRGRPGSELWTLSPGEAPRPLVRDREWFSFKGEFSRDGARVVYSRRRVGTQAHELASISRAGEELRILAGGSGRDAHSAQPSPTRDEIAFVARRTGDFDLYLLEPDGSERPLTRTPERDELAPRWSPDGERLVVTTAPAGAGRPRLVDPEGLAGAGVVVVDRDGRESFSAPGFMPDWMPAWR